jgi:D-aminopeptidase
MPRLRDLSITVGTLPTGPLNAITDVAGVLVGHTTLIADAPTAIRTGVTVVLPHAEIWQKHVFAGTHTLNGFGEMTGVHWVHEVGELASPVAITNSYAVGTVSDALFAYAHANGYGESAMPVVAETWDGWLNDIAAFQVRAEHVQAAIASASSGPVAEGNVGGGTGMICHGFKGGIGTSSRLAATRSGTFTVGALVQANYGSRQHLCVDGVPIGRQITPEQVPLPWERPIFGGSIIILVATDAPLNPAQCRRLAQRAALGLARVGGYGHNTSGDIFLAWSTANQLTHPAHELYTLTMLPNGQIDPLIDATVEAVEESIVNALCAAETMTGLDGHTAHALPHDLLQTLWRAAGRSLGAA